MITLDVQITISHIQKRRMERTGNGHRKIKTELSAGGGKRDNSTRVQPMS